MLKNLLLGPILPQIFFRGLFLPLLIVRHCSKLSSYASSRKTNKSENQKMTKNKSVNDKKPIGLDFDPFGPNLLPNFFVCILSLLVVRHCPKLLFYAMQKKTKELNFRKW